MSKMKVTESGNYTTMMSKLNRLKQFDTDIESKRKFWGTSTAISVIVAFLLLLGGGIAQFAPVLIMAGVMGAVFVFTLVIYIINVRKDLDNRKLDTAFKFVEMLGQDVPVNSNIALFIDFGDYLSSGKMTSKDGSFFSSTKEMTYEHPWLKCAGALYDGNRFTLEVTQDIKRKEKSKRKYTKIKEKIVEKASFTLKLNPRIYPASDKVAGEVKTGRLPNGIEIKRVMGKDRALKIGAITPPAIMVQGRYGKTGDEANLFDGDKLLAIVIDAYSGLQSARPQQEAPPQA